MNEASAPSPAAAEGRRRFSDFLGTASMAVLGAFLTAFTATVSSCSNSRSQIEIESRKFQAELIKKLIENPSPEERGKNLRFLAEAGLVPDFGPAILTYLQKGTSELPRVVATDRLPTTAFGADNRIAGRVLDHAVRLRGALASLGVQSKGRVDVTCTAVRIAPTMVLTAGFCVPAAVPAGDPGLADVVLKAVSGTVASGSLERIDLVGPASARERTAILVTAASTAGTVVVSRRAPKVGEKILLGYAPAPDQVLLAMDDECVISAVTAGEIAYRCDAGPGSAGGGVVSAETGELLALHSWTDATARHGIRLDTLPIPGL